MTCVLAHFDAGASNAASVCNHLFSIFDSDFISANEGLGAVYILCDDVMQALSEVLVAHSGDEEYLVA